MGIHPFTTVCAADPMVKPNLAPAKAPARPQAARRLEGQAPPPSAGEPKEGGERWHWWARSADRRARSADRRRDRPYPAAAEEPGA